MRTITQEGPSGCAVACVACILGVPYSKALKLFKNGDKKHVYRGFYCREIVAVFKKMGFCSRWEYVSKSKFKNIYKEKTVVFIKRSSKYPQGHYLVRVNKNWMDPWINMPDILSAKSGYRKKLPGKPVYAVYLEK